MAERVRSGAAVPAEPVAAPAGEPELVPCPARHCWVADALDGDGVKRPGLLVEWRQGPGGWQGRVVYAARARVDDWVLVEEWLPAELLTPC
ncbi:hypothetical protein [Nocardioides sp. SYSU D00038]|uniref:hypothetical protein n=1 Tax=Nocardioides sp. SYSU D00038 TaxID=2812554 RepID=UPI00196848F1|nr:hypothetical protein [Nocardioides sp. SYSU D00038]